MRCWALFSENALIFLMCEEFGRHTRVKMHFVSNLIGPTILSRLSILVNPETKVSTLNMARNKAAPNACKVIGEWVHFQGR